MADISLPHLATWPLFHGLAARVAPGPGMVMEWDMVPVAPVRIRRAVNVEPGHGPYPSLAMWGDSEDLRGGRFDGWEHLEQPYLEDGCGQQNHFRLVDGSILHFHHWAAGRRPFGLSQERLACWDSLLGGRQSGGPGTELKALLSRHLRVSRVQVRPPGPAHGSAWLRLVRCQRRANRTLAGRRGRQTGAPVRQGCGHGSYAGGCSTGQEKGH